MSIFEMLKGIYKRYVDSCAIIQKYSMILQIISKIFRMFCCIKVNVFSIQIKRVKGLEKRSDEKFPTKNVKLWV